MLLKGKRGLICGVANDKSIAWGIAKQAHENGAELIFSYQGEIFEKRVRPLAESVNSELIIECDVTNDESIKNMFEKIASKFGKIDFIVHSIAFANKDFLQGKYFHVSRESFAQAMDVSVYSLTSLCKHGYEYMNEGGSVVTMTYFGAEKVIKNYNVMGVAKAALENSVMYLANDMGDKNIRVNAISAGPIKTLAGSGIAEFRKMLKDNEINSPLKRNVTLEDIGGTAVYLLSNLGSGVTGENIHVDCGYSMMGSREEKISE